MGDSRHCRACAQLAPTLALPAGRIACRLARRASVCTRTGAVRLGHRYYHQRWFERPHQPPDHHSRRKRTFLLHAQPDLSRHVLGMIGLAIAFDNLWLPLTLAPFALVIRYGVVAREEAYLKLKFGDVHRRYRSHVRRWL